MSYQKILVAIGGSTGTSPILERAISLAQSQGAELMLFHCHEPQTKAEYEDGIITITDFDVSRSQRNYESYVKKEMESIRAWLEELCEQVRAEGIAVKSLAEQGKPGTRMIARAQHWGADLIILGRTQHRSLAEFILGSVSDYVIHHAKCSLLLVQ